MRPINVLAITGALLASGTASAQRVPPSEGAQEALFQQNCVVCHGNPATRAPARASLHAMSPD
ncbi:MAG: hypothetical protein JO143_09595, partial [Acetobacteraceae bacterium]|nr:hypothetical protein [Acetobacteraceae bacterium]